MTATALVWLQEQSKPMLSLAQPIDNGSSNSKEEQTLGDLLLDETAVNTEEEVATTGKLIRGSRGL